MDVPCRPWPLEISYYREQQYNDFRCDQSLQGTITGSMVCPNDGVVMWASNEGLNLSVLNIRTRTMAAHHGMESKIGPNAVVISPTCVLYVAKTCFIVVISVNDKSFRKVITRRTHVRDASHRFEHNLGDAMVEGRSMHLINEGRQLIMLMRAPGTVLIFNVDDILVAAHALGRVKPVEDHLLVTPLSPTYGVVQEMALCMVDDRIILFPSAFPPATAAAPPIKASFYHVKERRVYTEVIQPAAGGVMAPFDDKLYENFSLMVSPVNPAEVQLVASAVDKDSFQVWWTIGLRTDKLPFRTIKKELVRAKPLEDRHVVLDWTTSPSGEVYVRQEKLCYVRRSNAIARHYNRAPTMPFGVLLLQPRSLRALCESVLVETRVPRAERIRAARASCVSAADWCRFLAAHFYDHSSWVYFDGDQVYDDTQDLIERQRAIIESMRSGCVRKGIFRSLFNSIHTHDPIPSSGSSSASSSSSSISGSTQSSSVSTPADSSSSSSTAALRKRKEAPSESSI